MRIAAGGNAGGPGPGESSWRLGAREADGAADVLAVGMIRELHVAIRVGRARRWGLARQCLLVVRMRCKARKLIRT